MKCINAEKLILLQDSGELESRRSRSLETHLSGCDACRRFRQVLLDSAAAYSADRQPSAKALQNVLRTARTTAPIHRHQPVFGWKPALAACTIAVGLFFGLYSPDRIGMEIDIADAQLLESEDQVVSIMYDGLSEDDLAFNFLMTYEDDLEG